MADNVAITAGAGTNIATDDIGGVHYQRVKVTYGADGSATDPSSTAPFPIASYPVASGGATVHRKTSAASTNATSVKASAGQLYGYSVTNSNTSARYLKFFNKASAPTVGSDTPYFDVLIPGSGGVVQSIDVGIAFGAGISYALTTGAADSDTGAVAADEIKVTLFYK